MSTPTARLPKHIYLTTDPFGTPLYDALVSFFTEQQDLKVHELGTGDYYTAAANVGRAVAAAAEAAAAVKAAAKAVTRRNEGGEGAPHLKRPR